MLAVELDLLEEGKMVMVPDWVRGEPSRAR
jgi:hypothetical protein